MENQSPTPNTKDADKPELPADGCSTRFIIAYLKDGEWWQDTTEYYEEETARVERAKEVQAFRKPDAMKLLVRVTTETFISL